MITSPSQLADLMNKKRRRNIPVNEVEASELLFLILKDTEHKRFKIQHENEEGLEKIEALCVKETKDTCGDWKPIEEFLVNRGKKGKKEPLRVSSYCKACDRKVNPPKTKDEVEEVLDEINEDILEKTKMALDKLKTTRSFLEEALKNNEELIKSFSIDAKIEIEPETKESENK